MADESAAFDIVEDTVAGRSARRWADMYQTLLEQFHSAERKHREAAREQTKAAEHYEALEKRFQAECKKNDELSMRCLYLEKKVLEREAVAGSKRKGDLHEANEQLQAENALLQSQCADAHADKAVLLDKLAMIHKITRH